MMTEAGRTLLENDELTRAEMDVMGLESFIIAIEQEAVTRALDALAAVMDDVYTYNDPDCSVPTLPFIDDWEAFWQPFAAKVRDALIEQAKGAER
jgi:hypothetical protein